MPAVQSKPAVLPKSLASKVKIYKPEEIDLPGLSQRSRYELGKTPKSFQLDFFSNVMQGRDIVLDVGTGSGKSLCIDLPVLPNQQDIVLVIAPLTALMLEQAASSDLVSIAICQETLAAEGRDTLYKKAAEGTAQRIFVSPEVAGSLEFSTKVLAQPRFQEHLRLVFIDEAHCVSLWGGSFRSEYAELGVLRGRVSPSVTFAIASATLPTHVLEDVCAKLKIGKDAVTIAVSNARPNVALSVRKIVHPDDTKADLRFLIQEDATSAADIPTSLVYFNQRIETEDACDRLQVWAASCGIETDAIAFYHAKIGTARKRDLERMLREGKVRILCCTDAVGMGCDMRNIRRVILWKLPPSFCALAQRSGRAARDFESLGEAILFVSSKVIKDGIVEEQARLAREEAAHPENQEGELDLPPPPEVVNPDVPEGLDIVGGQAVVVAEGGARVEQGLDAEDVDAETPEGAAAKTAKKKRKAARVSFADSHEAKFLSRFSCTTVCRRVVWDDYFQNALKAPLATAAPIGARCCDICEPARFPVELVEVEKIPGLKGGKKRKFPPGLSDMIRTHLRTWSRTVLMPLLYPKEAGFSMTGSALLPDSTIEQLATCGEYIDSMENLQRRARWFLMPTHGDILLAEMKVIFQVHDLLPPEPEDAPVGSMVEMILGIAGPQTTGRGRGRGRSRAPRARGTTSRARGTTRARGTQGGRAVDGERGRTRGRPRGGRRGQ